jgi:hypothetical protein
MAIAKLTKKVKKIVKKAVKEPVTLLAASKKPVSKPVVEDKAVVDAKGVKFSLYPTKNYCEEYQVTGFHYAFMSTDNKMCHHWIKCRDFLQDALRNQLTGRSDQIYSFHYQPGKDPKVGTNTTRMLVKRVPAPANKAAEQEFDGMMKSALTLVNHYERAHKFAPRSTLIKAKHDGKDQYVYLFKGPGIWSQGAVMIAIYTFLIRLGHFMPVFKDEASLLKEYDRIMKDPKASNDTRYLKTVHKNLHPALKHRHKHLFKGPGWKSGDKVLFHDSAMSSFHHHSGIVSLSQFNTPEKGLNDTFRKIFAQKKT